MHALGCDWLEFGADLRVGLSGAYNGAYGYEYIPFTGLYHVGAREYDPRTARWLRRDPIDVAGGHPNVYVYCGNEPLNLADSEGLRRITKKDKERLRRLYAYNKRCSEPVPMSMINAAVREIKKAIEAVPEGQPDPPNLKALWWALDELGNARWGRAGTVAPGHGVSSAGAGTWKCNYFVAEAYAKGAGLGYGGTGVPVHQTSYLWGLYKGGIYPPSAEMWSDRTKTIANFQVVSSAQLGDIIAFKEGGHCTLKCGPGLLIYAGSTEAKLGTFDYVRRQCGPTFVIRRYCQP